jgi:hypothetical protein
MAGVNALLRGITGSLSGIVIPNFAVCRRIGTDDTASCGGFATSAFADEAERLTLPDREVDSVDGTHLTHDRFKQAAPDRKVHLEIAHFQQRIGRC